MEKTHIASKIVVDRLHYFLQIGWQGLRDSPAQDKTAASLTIFFAWLANNADGIQALIGLIGGVCTVVWMVFRILVANEDYKSRKRNNQQ